jgi:hypothetical protein
MLVADAPLDPRTVPDRIISMASQDPNEKEQANIRFKELVQQYKDPASKEFRYLNSIQEAIFGTVSSIANIRKKFEERVKNHDWINEEAVSMLAAIITALSTSNFDIPIMAAICGAVTAGIKLIFTYEKGSFKSRMEDELEIQVSSIITTATDKVKQIHDEIYTKVESVEMKDMEPAINSIAKSYSLSVILPRSTFFSLRRSTKSRNE